MNKNLNFQYVTDDISDKMHSENEESEEFCEYSALRSLKSAVETTFANAVFADCESKTVRFARQFERILGSFTRINPIFLEGVVGDGTQPDVQLITQ